MKDPREMRKIVINRCHGGFGLSDSAIRTLAQIKGVDEVEYYDLPRDDADLVAVVESMGKSAWGPYSVLKIVEIPEDVVWVVEEYDGMEWVAEVHRIWD